ncbi:MAG: type II secretion system protein N [Parerythrobacter sp.]
MTPRQARISVNAFAVLMVASVALALAGLTWRLVGYTGDDPVLLPDAGSVSQGNDLAPLIALAPFGVAVSDSAALASATGGSLKAVFAAVDANASVALIAAADGTVAEYRVGDTTPAGIIERIETEHVVLRTANGQRILGFDADATGSTATGSNAPRSATTNATPTPSPQPVVTEAATGVDAIRNLIPQSQQNNTADAPPPPSSVPVERSSSAGYDVGANPPQILRSAGIRAGDVIQNVNGTRIESAAGARRVLANARGSGSARVEVLRNGKTVSLSVPTR